jgi:hypothetical protein
MSTNQSFNRIVTLEVYDRKESTVNGGNSVLNNIDKKGQSFVSRFEDGTPGFRIKFRVTKPMGLAPEPPAGEISIYNVGEKSRNLLSKTNNLVLLKAGYGDNPPDLLFSGNIFHAITRKEGADYVTRIEAADGLFAFQNSLINESLPKGISFTQVFQSLMGNLKGAGLDQGQVKGIPAGGYNNGIVLSGSTIEQLRQFTEQHNLNFQIDNGKVQILPYGSSKGNTAIVLTPDTGLIGIPEIRGIALAPGTVDLANASQQQRTQISFTCLLNPKIISMTNVVIISKFVNGLFITTRVDYEGDSWSGPFFTHAEAFEASGSAASGVK